MTEAYTNEYTDIRTAATAAMRDTCQVGTQSAPTDNDPASVVWTYSATISCGLTVETRGETRDGAQATLTEATLRVPWGTAISTGDRIKLISQAGVVLSPSPVYAVDGEPYQHIANVQVRLVRLTGESIL